MTMKQSFGGILSTVLLVAGTALAAGLPNKRDGYTLKESVSQPNGWIKHDVPVPADHRITLRIGLPQNNFAELERHLNEISDPDHWRYGDHLSKEEVETLVAPHPQSLDAVDAWLSSHGISIHDIERSPAKDWAIVKVPVALAEVMLDTVSHSAYFV
jgi:tripeptidyl-peptidase I